jgi:hypothetical protein
MFKDQYDIHAIFSFSLLSRLRGLMTTDGAILLLLPRWNDLDSLLAYLG